MLEGEKLFLTGGSQSDYCFTYVSQWPISKCITAILEKPWEYQCKAGWKMLYRCEYISNTQLYITFVGGQFRRSVRTEYIASFSSDSTKTIIHLTFQKEILNGFFQKLLGVHMPPCTLPEDINSFMWQKCTAVKE